MTCKFSGQGGKGLSASCGDVVIMLFQWVCGNTLSSFSHCKKIRVVRSGQEEVIARKPQHVHGGSQLLSYGGTTHWRCV